MPISIPPASSLLGAVVSRPTTLSARAAERLAAGPLDALTLMRDVCRVDRLQPDAAERMAEALLSSHGEFVRLASGHWALRGDLLASPTAPDAQGSSAASDSASNSPSAATVGYSAVNFAVVDVETTGSRAGHGDRITEIAIVQVRGGEVVDVYSQLVNPERPIPPFITSLTQITWEMVKHQPVFRQVADEVTSRLAGHVFVAHNATFDWGFVREELSMSGIRLAGPRLCTVRLARLLLPQLARRSLDHVTRHFGIDISARHRAAGDAEATAKVLLRLLRVAEDEGLSTWPMLEARLSSPASRRSRTASEKRRRAFPHPAIEDYIA